MKNCSKCSATIDDSDYLCTACTAKSEEMANVEEMCDIITDDAATADERRMALHTLVGLLAPDMLNSPEVQVEAEAWDDAQGVPPKPLTQEDYEDDRLVLSAANEVSPEDPPVTTAVYLVRLVMNESDASLTDAEHIQALSDEIQRVMDDAGFTEDLRYNAVKFQVLSRTQIGKTHEATNAD